MNDIKRILGEVFFVLIRAVNKGLAKIAVMMLRIAGRTADSKCPDRKKIILVVDDEVDLSDLVRFQLTAKGYKALVAHNGLEALKMLEKNFPDLIILDINMPGMGGLEFYNKISTGYGRSKYPILVVTARANLEETFRDIEIDGFMTKPFEINHLIAEVDRLTSGDVNPVIFLVDFKEKPQVKRMTEALNKERYDVVHVEDFWMLRTKAETKKPEFIVLEYMQKEMDGDKFVKTIKADPIFQGVPVIVYSYAGFKEHEERSLQAGADKYLGKPEDARDLLRAMKELKIERRKRLSQEGQKS